MEARAPLARASQIALKLVAWALTGLLAALVIAWVLSPRWVGFCSSFNDRQTPCAFIDTPRMLGYVTTALGLLLMTVGPVVTTLWKLFRHGYDWETSHVEPAHVNGPIVLGIAYFIGGMLIVVAT
jgi:hypothetical protein